MSLMRRVLFMGIACGPLPAGAADPSPVPVTDAAFGRIGKLTPVRGFLSAT
jgi:hypothetical protein